MVSSTASTLALGGPAEVVLGEESFPAQTAIAIRGRQATIQSKRKPPGISTSQNRVSKTGRADRPILDAENRQLLAENRQLLADAFRCFQLTRPNANMVQARIA
jgi:hypothetical protein